MLESELVQAKRELRTLYAALDNVDSGLLILDAELRAVFSNPALHRIFKSFSAEEIRQRKPTYEELLRGAATAAAVDVEDYVAKRLAWVQSGDDTSMDIRMNSGVVLRCHLTTLPDGGRMLIYSDVTDITRHSEELERLATIDGMTGIYNRRHFMTLADHEWTRAHRYNRPLSLVMLDIDRFKSINDTYGHQTGDEVLQHLATLATSCKRLPDVLARIGGEEFALLLPETDLLQAQHVAERLRIEIAREPLLIRGRSIPITVSIGAAIISPPMLSISDLVSSADTALYKAKHAGRNRVVCALPSDDAPPIADQAAELSPPLRDHASEKSNA